MVLACLLCWWSKESDKAKEIERDVGEAGCRGGRKFKAGPEGEGNGFQ